ncbi:MAG: hypothetical protein GY719_17010 [bacterium]|nr:hypothetical protein [bacterium]
MTAIENAAGGEVRASPRAPELRAQPSELRQALVDRRHLHRARRQQHGLPQVLRHRGLVADLVVLEPAASEEESQQDQHRDHGEGGREARRPEDLAQLLADDQAEHAASSSTGPGPALSPPAM